MINGSEKTKHLIESLSFIQRHRTATYIKGAVSRNLAIFSH